MLFERTVFNYWILRNEAWVITINWTQSLCWMEYILFSNTPSKLDKYNQQIPLQAGFKFAIVQNPWNILHFICISKRGSTLRGMISGHALLSQNRLLRRVNVFIFMDETILKLHIARFSRQFTGFWNFS